jgi:AraC-like DNA-binding protein
MSDSHTSPPNEVTIKLKHRDWEIQVSCVETKIREVIENVLSSIENASPHDPALDLRIQEISKEIELLKTTLNTNILNRNMIPRETQRRTAQKTGSTCRSLLENLLFEGYFETERLLGNVHEELSRRGYNYDRTAVSHSLTDMVRENILSRVGSMRNYRYKQKKPPSEI